MSGGALEEPASAAGPVRVALVEDDEILRGAFVQLLDRPGLFELCASVATLAEGIRCLELRPDVLLIDLALPDGSGLDLIALARQSMPSCRILVITVFADVRSVVRAIEAGADGYLLKESDGYQLSSAIDTVMAGGAPISPAVASHILARVRDDAVSRAPADAVSLTTREVQILQALANGMSFKEVAGAHKISHHTVGDHVKSIYRKLQVNSRGEAVYKALRDGIVRVQR